MKASVEDVNAQYVTHTQDVSSEKIQLENTTVEKVQQDEKTLENYDDEQVF